MMSHESGSRQLPLSPQAMRDTVKQFPTPFYLYDEAAIRDSVRRLHAAFAWCDNFRNYFAVKATPNPHVLHILHEAGCGCDCSSVTELQLCRVCGITGQEVMFTSNNTPLDDYRAAREWSAIINLDDPTHLADLLTLGELPAALSFRYNPGSLRSGNAILGQPEQAKFGATREQLLRGYQAARQLGVRRFGLHTMIASNERDVMFFADTAQMLFRLCVDILKETGVQIQFVNLGGGVGIPYRPSERAVDLQQLSQLVQQHYQAIIQPAGLHPLTLCMENGRLITGPHGYLITQVVHTKSTYKNFVGVDACMANLMRPGMYGAYHHISVLGKEQAPHDLVCDVVGGLCENNDKFAIDRQLPPVERGDVLVIHDVGAHGHAMGFQYNGRLRSAELLLQADGAIRPIRRAETPADYFATLDYPGLKDLT